MHNPDSWIEGALEELKLTLAGKNEDYRIDGEFSNFEFAADVVGVDPVDVMVTQIAIKLGRIRGLKGKSFVNNESLLDSFKDLAGYAAIAYAYALANIGKDEWDV